MKNTNENNINNTVKNIGDNEESWGENNNGDRVICVNDKLIKKVDSNDKLIKKVDSNEAGNNAIEDDNNEFSNHDEEDDVEDIAIEDENNEFNNQDEEDGVEGIDYREGECDSCGKSGMAGTECDDCEDKGVFI